MDSGDWQKRYLQNLPTMVHTRDFIPCTEGSPFAGKGSITKAQEQIAAGRVACFVLAGGQGSRVGGDLPKALIPVSVVCGKTLLQLLCERTHYASVRYGCPLSLVVLTSTYTDAKIRLYLQANSYFGLPVEQVYFVLQEDLPVLREDGEFLQAANGLPVTAPSGNGDALHLLWKQGVGEALYQKGVRHLHVVQIDNALADPFAMDSFAMHVEQQAHITVTAVPRESPQEAAGGLAWEGQGLRIVEYGQTDQVFPLVSTGMFWFSMDAIVSIVQQDKELPWHLARKIVQDMPCYKWERFLFDVFPFVSRFAVYRGERSFCFSPLKNAIGEKSFETVKRALLLRDQNRYKAITHTPWQGGEMELSCAFDYLAGKIVQMPVGSKVYMDWGGV